METNVSVIAHDGIGVVSVVNDTDHRWSVEELVTSIDGVPQAELAWLDVYLQQVSPLTHIDHTATAADDRSEVEFDLKPGGKIIAVYTGVRQDAACRFSVTTKDAGS